MSDRDEWLAAMGARLRKWRNAAGLSQAAAAKLIGASQGAWATWESGGNAPDIHFAFELERATCEAIRAAEWAYPRGKSKDADSTGPHVVAADDLALDRDGTEG
jgi:transcriptional regulator with XRE-family HTH domain